jgi:hypothetical protein
MSVRSKYLPKLSALALARRAYELAISRIDIQTLKFTVTDADIEHTESTRADVEAFIDDLARTGNITVLRLLGSQKSWVRVK